MKHIKITNNLFLREVPVARPSQTGEQILANNHIWIFDRSCSMSSTLNNLISDMIAKLPTLDFGDTLSVGWFSGEGQNDFILKGHQITSQDSIAKISTILNKYRNTIGCTCFSEILEKTDKVIEDLAPLNPLFSLVFFTDGYPVVRDLNREIQHIATAIEAIKAKLTSVLVVGYGAYYNKELLSDMASRLCGTLVHSANLAEYGSSLTEFLLDARETGGRVETHLPLAGASADPTLCFSINNKTVVAYKPDEAGMINFVMPRKGKSSYYVLVNSTDGDEPGDLSDVSSQRAAYAAALILTQRTKTSIALEILGALGDVALIDGVTNAFTNDEYGRVETLMRKAISSPSHRFVKGRNTDHLPKRDVFCLIDAVALLWEDEAVKFFPYFPGFKYNYISVKTKPKEGTPFFTPSTNPGVEIETLTWNNSMLNLCLTCRIPGIVKLDDDAPKHGFQKDYPTHIWRSYSIVKDGNANVPSLPLIISESTFLKFKEHGIVDAQPWQPGIPVNIHLDRMPVMNRAIADGKTSAKELAAKAAAELRAEFKIKALKKCKSLLELNGAVDYSARTALSPAQVDYLRKFHIDRNGFGPPEETLEPKDKYTAKEFTIKIKNFSSIPTLNDVDKKMKKITEYQKNPKGKEPKLTPAETLMAESISWVDRQCGKNLTMVSSTLAVTLVEMNRNRKEIQRTKFAILLGKRWFDEFNSREECSVDVEGFTFTFNLREVEVDI